MARRFQELDAWMKARELVRNIYAATASGPLAKDFALRDQLRRAAISVMGNIAEGFARRSHAEFARFIDIARGSAAEVQSLLYVGLDIGGLAERDFRRLNDLSDHVIALLTRLADYLRKPRD